MIESDKGKSVDDDKYCENVIFTNEIMEHAFKILQYRLVGNHKCKSMMLVDDYMYWEKVIFNEEIRLHAQNILQNKMAESEKGKSMMSVDDDGHYEKVINRLAESDKGKSMMFVVDDRYCEKVILAGGNNEICTRFFKSKWHNLRTIDFMFGISDFDLGKHSEVMKDKLFQEHVCEEEVHLDNSKGKLSHDLIEMPSEALEQGMDDHVPDEIDSVKCYTHSMLVYVVRKMTLNSGFGNKFQTMVVMNSWTKQDQ
ncbi:hypothetical protein Tco_0281256 [Tanacetum coccineum]